MLTYHLQILTPEYVFFDDQVLSLIASGADGYFGVLANHTPLISQLKPGIFILTDKNQKRLFFDASEGFFEVHKNQATVLIDKIQPRDAPIQWALGNI